jgi:hypothetical protein
MRFRHNSLLNDDLKIIGVIDFDEAMAASIEMEFLGLERPFAIEHKHIKMTEPKFKEYKNLVEDSRNLNWRRQESESIDC